MYAIQWTQFEGPAALTFRTSFKYTRSQARRMARAMSNLTPHLTSIRLVKRVQVSERIPGLHLPPA